MRLAIQQPFLSQAFVELKSTVTELKGTVAELQRSNAAMTKRIETIESEMAHSQKPIYNRPLMPQVQPVMYAPVAAHPTSITANEVYNLIVPFTLVLNFVS